MPRIQIPADHAANPLAFAWSEPAPEMGKAAAAYALAVYENSRLSMREMEAARMRTAHINGCHLCLGMRAERDLAAFIDGSGGDSQRTAQIRDNTPPDEAFYEAIADWRNADGFSERELLAIEYAERMGESPKSMDEDEAFWARTNAAFSDAEIVDLTLCIGMWISMGRFAHVLALDSVCTPAMAAADA